MSRRLKLVIGLVMLQAVALIAVLGITYWASQDLLLRFSESYAARISRDATAYTEGFLEPANETAEITRRMLETGLLAPDDRSELQRYFLELLNVHQDFDGVYLGEKDGDFLYASRSGADNPGAYGVKTVFAEPVREVRYDWYSDALDQIHTEMDNTDTYDPRQRPWYTAAIEKNAAAWTSPYVFFTSQTPGITVAVPIKTDPIKPAIGAVGVDIKIAELSAFLGSLDISQNGRAAIVAENGDIIAHSAPDLMEGAAFKTVTDGSDPILAKAAAQIEGGLDTLFPGEIRLARFEIAGKVWIGSVLRLELERTPWTVVTYLPESDILEPLFRVRNTALMVSILALLATALLGFLYGRTVMAKPRET